jgi:hypothetical protein
MTPNSGYDRAIPILDTCLCVCANRLDRKRSEALGDAPGLVEYVQPVRKGEQ